MLITSLLVMIFTCNKLHKKAGVSAVLLMCNTTGCSQRLGSDVIKCVKISMENTRCCDVIT